MIIDIFAHHISRRVGKILSREKYYGEGRQFNYPARNGDAEVRLGLMDKYRIDVQALSQTTPVLLGFSADEAAEICRLSNDDNYALCKAYPERFVNICIFSLLDVKKAMKELERSVNELDCRGVTIATNQSGKGLDSVEYFTFYEKVAEYGLPIFLQPTHWESYPLVDMEQGYGMMSVFGWPFDTTQAVWRLIFGGVLERYPPLKIITHHCGALLPFFVKRAEGFLLSQPTLRAKLARPVTEYWKNIYGDTCLGRAPSALACGFDFLGPDRMMYASDYPFGAQEGEGGIRDNLDTLKGMNIPLENIRKILGENAQKLLKIK